MRRSPYQIIRLKRSYPMATKSKNNQKVTTSRPQMRSRVKVSMKYR
jgi:hypothetical protein